jgi:OmpA-OmpF porin, OOP family
MYLKKFTILWCVSLLALTSFAQDDDYWSSPKKGSLIGFSANITDFSQPLSISNSFKNNNANAGFSIMYWKGLSNRIDLSARYNGVFTDYSKNSSSTSSPEYGNEFELSLHGRALTDNHLFQPFITAGIGVGGYGGKWAPYAPLGGGLQFNFESITYVFLQLNYRASLNKTNLDNNLFYSLGITETISKPKMHAAPKMVMIPAVEPPKDTDGDGIPDKDDKCPTVAGVARYNGCPIPDTDGDGINDEEDKCPTVAGVAKYHGCPIPDTDGDGINDDEDQCPTVAGVAKYHGCPIPDTDGDGINDEEDRCPTIPGVKENQGCPLVREEILRRVIYDAKNIFFATGSFKLLPKSYRPLNEVAKILKEDANLKLDISGYTDNQGKPEKNQALSEKRANAVMTYLKEKGAVQDGRLTAAGYGETHPIATNKTAKGRAQNRRVELKLNY